MRKITKKTVKSFYEGKPVKIDNTEVKVTDEKVEFYLFRNKIAWRDKKNARAITITNCGYQTATTKERLNGLLMNFNSSIFQKNWSWYISHNGSEAAELWDGKPKKLI